MLFIRMTCALLGYQRCKGQLIPQQLLEFSCIWGRQFEQHRGGRCKAETLRLKRTLRDRVAATR